MSAPKNVFQDLIKSKYISIPGKLNIFNINSLVFILSYNFVVVVVVPLFLLVIVPEREQSNGNVPSSYAVEGPTAVQYSKHSISSRFACRLHHSVWNVSTGPLQIVHITLLKFNKRIAGKPFEYMTFIYFMECHREREREHGTPSESEGGSGGERMQHKIPLHKQTNSQFQNRFVTTEQIRFAVDWIESRWLCLNSVEHSANWFCAL